MDGEAKFSSTAIGAPRSDGVDDCWMFNVKCGGRFEVNFLLGTGVVGRPDVNVVVAVDFDVAFSLEAISVSVEALKLLSLMTSSATPVTLGETALAKLQLDILAQFYSFVLFVRFQMVHQTIITCYFKYLFLQHF